MFRGLSVNPTYLRASYHVYKIGLLLVRDISLPAAQLFVFAIENFLGWGVDGQFNKRRTAIYKSVQSWPILLERMGAECWEGTPRHSN